MPEHDGHVIEITYDGTWSKQVDRIDENGNVVVTGEVCVEDVDSTELWCSTCGFRVTGTEIGAAEDWEEV
jgi:hypothetical protein